MARLQPDVTGSPRRRRVPAAAAAAAAVIAGVVLVSGLGPARGAPVPGRPRPEREVPVTAMNLAEGPAANSPVIAIDPNNPDFVALAHRFDAPDFGCGLALSGDGGRSWVPAAPVTTLPQGADKCYAPEIGFDPSGVLYYLFVGLEEPGNRPMGAFLTTSTDRGRSFAEPRRVLGPRNYGVRLAVSPDGGRVHLAWLHAASEPSLGGFGPPPNPILTAHSDDGGRTFSKPAAVGPPGDRKLVAPALAAAAGGRVHVAYYDLGDDGRDYHGLDGPVWAGPWSLHVSTSDDDGDTWRRPATVTDGVAAPERVMLIFTMAPPSLAAGPGDRVCAAWSDARHGDPDALLSCSDGGDSWSGPRRLNDDGVANGRRQYLPRISVAPDGRIDAVFLDRRLDPENVSNDVYYTYSRDGGRSFAANVRLTRRSSSSRIGQRYVNVSARGQVEIGSRLGLASGPAGALAAWPDTRNSNPLTTEQDVFAATVELSLRRRPSAWLRGAGIALIALGIGAAIGLRGAPRPRRTHAVGTA